MRRWRIRALVAAGSATVLAISAVGVAAADTVTNSVGSGVQLVVAPGSSITVGFKINPTTAPPGDPAGCNVSSQSKIMLTIRSSSYANLTIGGKAQDDTVKVSSCHRTIKETFVLAASAVAGTVYHITAQATGGTGTVTTTNAAFDILVTPSVAATSLTLDPLNGSAPYGTPSQGFTATLLSGGSPVVGRTVSFTFDGASVGTAVTNSSGVASLNVPLGTTYDVTPSGQPYDTSATFDGDASYAASSTLGTFGITQADQTPMSVTGPTSGAYGQTLPITYSGSSGTGALHFGASGACSLSGGTSVHIDSGSGSCTVTGSRDGDTNYTAVTATPLTFSVGPAAQSALSITGPTSATFGAADSAISTDGGDGLGGVTFDAGGSTGCSIVSGLLHVTNASGTCVITATKAADSNYGATTSAPWTVGLVKATQTVTILGPSHGTFGQTYPIQYSSGPGTGGVSFSAAGTACEVVGMQVHITSGTGSCSLTATQAADDNYTQATSAAYSVTPDKATATITVTGLSATYDGASHPVSATVTPAVSGLTVTYDGSPSAPTHANSYTVVASLDNPDFVAAQVTETLVIDPKPLTGAITAESKEYDGTTTAVVHAVQFTSADLIGTDTVTLSASGGAFTSAAAGLGQTVTATISLGGDSAGDYRLSSTTASTTADITHRVLIGSITASGKTYDGTTAATAAAADPALDRVVGTDDVTLVVGIATFDAPDAGDRVVTAAISLTGTGADNYVLKSSTASAPATIDPLTVGVTLSAQPKVYDGSRAATVTAELTGVLAGDTVVATPYDSLFDTKDVGTGKTVTTGLQLDNSNYALPAGPFRTTADITAKSLTGTFTAANKIYDGTANASVTGTSLAGVVPGETVTLTVPSATFADKNVGTGKVVSATGAPTIGGPDVGNYTLGIVQTTTADITAKDVSGTFTAANKTYDGSTTASVLTRSLSGAISGDSVSLAIGGASFGTKDVGVNKTVTAVDASLAGTDAGNYHLTGVGTALADITAAAVTVTASSYTLIKGAAVPTLGYTATGFVSGEGFTTNPTCTTTYTPSSPVGTYPVTCSGGVASSNYDVGYVAGAISVGYAYSQFLQPINVDRSSRFKAGSTIPVKFQLLDANGSVQNDGTRAFTLRVTKLDSTTSGDVNETAVTATGDSGTSFRWDSTGQLYIFNLSIKTWSMGEGTYRLEALSGTQVVVTGYIDVKR